MTRRFDIIKKLDVYKVLDAFVTPEMVWHADDGYYQLTAEGWLDEYYKQADDTHIHSMMSNIPREELLAWLHSDNVQYNINDWTAGIIGDLEQIFLEENPHLEYDEETGLIKDSDEDGEGCAFAEICGMNIFVGNGQHTVEIELLKAIIKLLDSGGYEVPTPELKLDWKAVIPRLAKTKKHLYPNLRNAAIIYQLSADHAECC